MHQDLVHRTFLVATLPQPLDLDHNVGGPVPVGIGNDVARTRHCRRLDAPVHLRSTVDIMTENYVQLGRIGLHDLSRVGRELRLAVGLGVGEKPEFDDVPRDAIEPRKNRRRRDPESSKDPKQLGGLADR